VDTLDAEATVKVSLSPQLATELSDARRQLHHAAQLATAAGISYLPAARDDSHTNLEWLDVNGMLASNVIPSTKPFRVAVRAPDLMLALLDVEDRTLAMTALNGRTIENAAGWLRDRLREIGTDPSRYTLQRHYEIPHHAVADGAPFDTTNAGAFAQLAAWYSIAADALESVRQSTPKASDVRCWPHHFDIAVSIDVAEDKTIGVGMEPGDVYYDEPYFYVNVYPRPAVPPTASLAGQGTWHTHEWIGAVLPVSRLRDNAVDDVRAFLVSAIAACRKLLDVRGH
jgi:hypothetical protein